VGDANLNSLTQTKPNRNLLVTSKHLKNIYAQTVTYTTVSK